MNKKNSQIKLFIFICFLCTRNLQIRTCMKFKFILIPSIILLSFSYNYAQHTEINSATLANKKIDGYCISNFAIAASVDRDGKLFKSIVRNPGELGKYLIDMGSATIYIKTNEKTEVFRTFSDTSASDTVAIREFPFAGIHWQKQGMKINLISWAPACTGDILSIALPVIMNEFKIQNKNQNIDSLSIIIRFDSLFKSQPKEIASIRYHAFTDNNSVIATDCPVSWQSTMQGPEMKIILQPGETKTIRLALGINDPEWISSVSYPDPMKLIDHIFSEWNGLKSNTIALKTAIPTVTLVKEVNDALRWYSVPAFILTKCTAKNEILTMGYRELNQRDSYWTSFMHLVFFPEAEKKMISESAASISKSGKIPTTILPLIERNDDVDINCYFILRVLRYSAYYNDSTIIFENLRAILKATEWLASRCNAGTGIPEQQSFWFDWKDVKGVDGRKYSPYASLLYLATLNQLEKFFEKYHQPSISDSLKTRYDKAYANINKSLKDGGLWNGHYYCQIFRDGKINQRLLQDQVVGILFGVVDSARSASIFHSIDSLNSNRFGNSETYPFYPEDFGYAPGTYHNGGVWQWLNFVDAWARIEKGKKQEGLEIIKKVAKADLETDHTPHEDINSKTGENIGLPLQGWDSDLFGLFWFGLAGKGKFKY